MEGLNVRPQRRGTPGPLSRREGLRPGGPVRPLRNASLQLPPWHVAQLTSGRGRSARDVRPCPPEPGCGGSGAPARLAVHRGLPPGDAVQAAQRLSETTSRVVPARQRGGSERPDRLAPWTVGTERTGRRRAAVARPVGPVTRPTARGHLPADLRGQEVPGDCPVTALSAEHGPGPDARGTETAAAVVGREPCLK